MILKAFNSILFELSVIRSSIWISTLTHPCFLTARKDLVRWSQSLSNTQDVKSYSCWLDWRIWELYVPSLQHAGMKTQREELNHNLCVLQTQSGSWILVLNHFLTQATTSCLSCLHLKIQKYLWWDSDTHQSN